MTDDLMISRRALAGGMVATLALGACSQVAYTRLEADHALAFAGDSPARHASGNIW